MNTPLNKTEPKTPAQIIGKLQARITRLQHFNREHQMELFANYLESLRGPEHAERYRERMRNYFARYDAEQDTNVLFVRRTN